jgi:hypothetical protein
MLAHVSRAMAASKQAAAAASSTSSSSTNRQAVERLEAAKSIEAPWLLRRIFHGSSTRADSRAPASMHWAEDRPLPLPGAAAGAAAALLLL